MIIDMLKQPPHVLIVSHCDTSEFLPKDWDKGHHFSNVRGIKKQFKNDTPALIIIGIKDEQDEELGKQVTEFIREGLCNNDSRIVLIKSQAFDLDEISWLELQQVNACLSADPDRDSFNTSVLHREIDTFKHIQNRLYQHEAESNMLMCITQFSRENEPLEELLKKFSHRLSVLCYSACGFHIKLLDNNECDVNYCDKDDHNFIDLFSQLIEAPRIPNYLQTVIKEKHPQIDLIPEKSRLTEIDDYMGITMGSYLTFPIVAYDKVLYLLVYLIPEEDMDKVSMKQINVINKASEQLTILLERRHSELTLKKQFERLKKTLIDLKSTQQELETKEKMASIGQMAAGIAHEINNPLSYVISNFNSMDTYLNNIMQLQKLQSEFLTSIDIGQDKNLQRMQKNISDLEEEADIPFVLEDIRAVVSDSYQGLQRVKNIITDLKSFTYSQSTELETCDMGLVIDETLKILKYTIEESGINITKKMDSISPIMGHSGLLQQVFTNLIKNAVQALSEAKTENPTITIKSREDGESIVLSIKDNGPGIAKDLQKRIFEPFFTTKTLGEGTGLGLSVTFNIIKKLGGNISCKSEPSQFTEFLITFNQINK